MYKIMLCLYIVDSGLEKHIIITKIKNIGLVCGCKYLPEKITSGVSFFILLHLPYLCYKSSHVRLEIEEQTWSHQKPES